MKGSMIMESNFSPRGGDIHSMSEQQHAYFWQRAVQAIKNSGYKLSPHTRQEVRLKGAEVSRITWNSQTSEPTVTLKTLWSGNWRVREGLKAHGDIITVIHVTIHTSNGYTTVEDTEQRSYYAYNYDATLIAGELHCTLKPGFTSRILGASFYRPHCPHGVGRVFQSVITLK